MTSAASDTKHPECEPDEVGLALCIYGQNLRPDSITSILACEPSHSHERGDGKGPRSKAYPEGAWIREVRKFEPIDVDQMFSDLFAPLPKERAVWQSLAAKYRVRIHFALHTEQGNNFDISPTTLQLIADRYAELFLDIYAYGDNDA